MIFRPFDVTINIKIYCFILFESIEMYKLSKPYQMRCRSRTTRFVTFAATKRKAPKQIACSKTLKCQKSKKKQIEQLCENIYEFSSSRRKETSAGIVSFEYFRDPEDDCIFHFWEVYESDDAFSNHTSSQEMKDFLKKASSMIDDGVGVSLYEIKDGNIGMAAIAEGPKGEGGLEDATGAGSVGGAGYTQTIAKSNQIGMFSLTSVYI